LPGLENHYRANCRTSTLRVSSGIAGDRFALPAYARFDYFVGRKKAQRADLRRWRKSTKENEIEPVDEKDWALTQ
jgi:hypothetical protein